MTEPELTRSVRIERVEVAAGVRVVNGQPHGLNWRRAYAVVVRFFDYEEADEFAEMARNWNRRAESQE